MRIVVACAVFIMLAVLVSGCTTTPASPPAGTGGAVTTLSTSSLSQPGVRGETVPIRIRDKSFDPNFVTVNAGTTLVWTNEDPISHTVTYIGTDAMKFDSGPITKGQSFSYTFTEPGRYTYTSKQFSFMTGTVVVR